MRSPKIIAYLSIVFFSLLLAFFWLDKYKPSLFKIQLSEKIEHEKTKIKNHLYKVTKKATIKNKQKKVKK